MSEHTLRTLRKRLNNTTQNELGDYLRVSGSTVANWESGKYFPTVDVVPKLAALFDLPQDEMLAVLLNDPVTAMSRRYDIPREKMAAIIADLE